MAYTSEIDKLEARWRENPKGRNFAPLADAYRKAGLIDNAIMLLESGLKLHPDYVSAYIVQARCLIDKKDDTGAQEVFRKVLTLDGENVIALRGLAEIAERNGRFDEEVEWLARLLNADPMNGDAAESLARAKAKATATPTVSIPKPEIEVEHSSPPATAATTPTKASTLSPEVETFESGVTFNPAAHAAAKAEGLEVEDDMELSSQQIEQVEVEGLARTQYEGSGMFRLDAPEPPRGDGRAPDSDEPLPEVDLPLIMPDEESAKPTPAPTRAAAPPRAVPDDDGAADTATLSRAEPVVTETMADLYLRQGHQQDALRVYQALLAQRPDDARLRSKVAQLASGGKKRSGVSAQDFLKGIWSGRGASAAQPPAEQSTLSAAFDVAGGGGGGAQTPGEPSHPAQDHISLDSVFGDEAARRANAAASPPPPPAGGEAAPAGGGGFSFDEFFAGGKGTPPADEGSPRTPGRSSGGGRSQRPVEDEVEADQFQQWLKKLKS